MAGGSCVVVRHAAVPCWAAATSPPSTPQTAEKGSIRFCLSPSMCVCSSTLTGGNGIAMLLGVASGLLCILPCAALSAAATLSS